MIFNVSRKFKMSELIDMSNDDWTAIIEELRDRLKAKMDGFDIEPQEYEVVLYNRISEARMVYMRAERRK